MPRLGSGLRVFLLSWIVLAVAAGASYSVRAATCYKDVVVSNSAYEPANATYRFVDFYQYKPVYRRIHDDGSFYPPYERIHWSGSQWVVMVGGTNRLIAQVDTPTPPNIEGCSTCPTPWIRVNCGIPGPITVTVRGGDPLVALGDPATTALTTGEAYAYAPEIPEGCAPSYVFSIVNQPLWLSFDTTTGVLTGTPTSQDVGTHSGIRITATHSDGSEIATEAFAITVDSDLSPADVAGTDVGTAPEASKADLMIQSMTYTPKAPSPSDQITCSVVVKNSGDADAPASTLAVAVWSDPDVSPPGVAYDTKVYQVPALPAGASHSVTHQIPNLHATTGYTLRAQADANDDVAEGSEDIPNYLYASIGFTRYADLMIQSMTCAPKAPSPSDQITCSVVVKNSGDADAPASTLAVAVWSDPDVSPPGVAYDTKVYQVPALPAGASHTVTHQLPDLQATTGYTLRAQADANDDVAEGSEDIPNHLYASIGFGSPGACDLIVASMSTAPEVVVDGEEFTVAVTVENIGTAVAEQSRVALHPSWTTASAVYSDIAYSQYESVPQLAPGASYVLEFKMTLPEVQGTPNLTADADVDEVVDESTELNNRASMWLTTQKAKPDLVIASMSTAPEVVVDGEEFTVAVTVENIGTAVAEQSRVALHPSWTTASAVYSDIAYSQYESVPQLAPGASYVLEFKMTLPEVQGTPNLTADADVDEVIDEPAELNNRASMWLVTEVSDGLGIDCYPERLVTRGESLAPTQEELDWAAQHGLAYADTPKPDGTTGDSVEWIERVWSGGAQFCVQTIAMVEPPLECPAERTVLCNESADPTSDELQWAAQHGLIYWDDGPKPVPGGTCGVEWIERFWGENEGDANACSQGIDILTPTPTLIVPADATVSGCVSVASINPSTTGTASVEDPCGILVLLEYQDETDHSLNPQIGTFHRVWKATDKCGNTNRETQTITISPPYPYLTGAWAGSFAEGDIVVDNISIRPQPPIFGNDQAHTLLIVAHAANTAEPPEEEDPLAQTATLTASVDGLPAGSATLSLLPGESGIRHEIRVDIPQVPGCHEVSLSMAGATIYGSVFIHPIGVNPDF